MPDASAIEQGSAYRAGIATHRMRRQREALGSDGWISVIGLHWLEEGDCVVGNGADADLRLADPALPARCGVFERRGNSVRFVRSESAPAMIAGLPVDSVSMVPDSEPDPTMLEFGAYRLFVIDRDGQLGIRIKDLNRAASLAPPPLEFWPADERWSIAADIVRRGQTYPGRDVFGVPHAYGASVELRFALNGMPCALLAFDPPRYARLQADLAADEVSVLFVDPAAAPKHRSVTVSVPAGDRAVIDFNRAENPHCSFSDHVPCPLPPAANRLPVAVTAGEKIWALQR